MARNTIADATGTHDLAAVVSIRPMSAPVRGQLPKQTAVLVFVGGAEVHTATDYATAVKQWLGPPSAQPPAAPAAPAQPQPAGVTEGAQ
jgi:hypothetical protein